MKPIENLVKDNIKNLKPCVHGGEVWDAAGKSGLKRDEILDFSSSVNPLGPSKRALEAAKAASKKSQLTQTQTATHCGRQLQATLDA